MALKNIIITGSIGTYPTLSYGQKEYVSSTDEESFPIEQAIGGNAGALPNLLGQTSSVDLFVNIDQKWSGYNDTPTGLVAFTHSIQDEFINGEFSGSAYVVTDGELVDEDCQKFLEVNTSTVTYNPFFYSDFFTNLGSFLYSNTSPNNGEIYLYVDIINLFANNAKTTYIKVNRYDNEGNDNTLSLQELTTLRLQTSLGILNLNLLSITEYPSYYLYATDTPISISCLTISPDSNVLNYYVSASNNSTQTSSVLHYTSAVGNSLGYLNLPSGVYTLGGTPNVPLYIEATASLNSINGTLGTQINLYKTLGSGGLYGISGFSSTSANISPGGSVTLYTSGSLTPLEGEMYVLVISDDTPIDTDITASSVNFIVQSLPPSSSTNLTILEPYLTENFYYNDCNVLFGNQDGLEYSNDFMKVNYDDGALIPSNQQEILNNTAERAPVKPYNYALNAQILPRYNGVRLTQQSPFLNRDPNNNQMFFTGDYSWTQGDISPDKTPSVNQTTTYFAYFSGLKSNNPIFKDTTSPVIKYIIGEDGTTFNPATDDATYYNMVFSFPEYSKAYANLLYDVTTIFNSPQSISLSGKSYVPILYNLKEYSGNNANWTGSLNFTNIIGGYTSNPNNFDFYKINNSGPSDFQKQLLLFSSNYNPVSGYNLQPDWSTVGPYVISMNNSSTGTKINSNSSEINPFYWGTGSAALYNGQNGYGPNDGTWVQDIDTTPTPDPVTGSYYEFTNIPQSSVNIEGRAYIVMPANSAYVTPRVNNGNFTISFRLRIYLKRGSNVSQLGYKDHVNLTSLNILALEGNYSVNVNGFFPQLNDKIFFTVENIGSQPFGINVYRTGVGNGSSVLKISTNEDIGTVTDSPYFWITGSTNDTVITSSLLLGSVLQGNYKQTDITTSGFDPIQLPAYIEIGDEFRFEYDENNVFEVIDSSLYGSGSGVVCSVTFNRPIPTSPSLNINHFTVRRKVKDYITGISLDNNLAIPISGGFLLPENPSDKIKSNLPKITSDLSEKNKI